MPVVVSRGKGDYHRLGHGSDDHVRRPRKVSALQNKKVIDVACGSLHCVACTDTGKAGFDLRWCQESKLLNMTGVIFLVWILIFDFCGCR